MRIVLSLALLFAGCYTNTAVTKDSALTTENHDLTFHLTDGTYITSKSDHHHRVENGYKVAGKLNSHFSQSWREFDGMVRDDQIKDITISEYNEDLTTIAIVGTVLVLGAITCVIVSNVSSSLLSSQ